MASSYASRLPPRARTRYVEKLRDIQGVDPFQLLEKKKIREASRTDLSCVDVGGMTLLAKLCV